jgi:hypothetical protein
VQAAMAPSDGARKGLTAHFFFTFRYNSYVMIFKLGAMRLSRDSQAGCNGSAACCSTCPPCRTSEGKPFMGVRGMTSLGPTLQIYYTGTYEDL